MVRKKKKYGVYRLHFNIVILFPSKPDSSKHVLLKLHMIMILQHDLISE